MISKTQVATLDATPSKRIFLSIIADYGLNTAISELVDNAYDSWNRPTKGQDLVVEISCDTDQQKIKISDNAGGVRESDLRKLISPGESNSNGGDSNIGVFGVGSKRAAVALSQLIRITSRFRKQSTYRIEYDDAWLRSPDWHIPYFRVEQLPPSNTLIELSDLRFKIDETSIESLREHLNVTYHKIIQKRNIKILLNDVPILGRSFENWSFSPESPPKSFTKKISLGNKKPKVDVTITGGLSRDGGSIAGDWGVFFYCNDRLIAKSLKIAEVGFITGLAGLPHPRMSLARVIVEISGRPDHQPWTSSKSGINFNHPLFQSIKRDITETVKTYTRLSKVLQEHFDEKIAPFESGLVEQDKLKASESITQSRLPLVPRSTPRIKDRITELNKKVASEMPWTRGLYEGIIAESVISKQRTLEQRNRIALIILDSTVEIALKDFLAYSSKQPLNDEKLTNLFKNRINVQDEVAKQVLTGDPIWRKLNYFYKQRCDLVHRRANPSISDEMISDFRKTVQKLLSGLFGLRFPKE